MYFSSNLLVVLFYNIIIINSLYESLITREKVLYLLIPNLLPTPSSWEMVSFLSPRQSISLSRTAAHIKVFLS